MSLIGEHVFCNVPDLTDCDRRVLDVYGQLTGQDSLNDGGRKVLRKDFLDDGSRCFVLSTDEVDAVGVARYISHPEIRESFLQGIVIDEPYRRRKLGYGTLMIDFLMEQTKNDGNRLLSLDAYPEAIVFYKDQGFVQTTKDPTMPEMIKYVS